MDGTLDGDVVRVGGDARQRFYDSRGYGRPTEGNRIELAPVEAAHLLARGDLDAVDGMDFREFLTRTGAVMEFVVYKDLRDRGFYLSPTREDWSGVSEHTDVDFVVFPRGKGPWDDDVEYRIRIAGERESIAADALGDVVLAIVDEDGELTYFETDRPEIEGADDYEPPSGLDAGLLSDRVLLWESPDEMYERGFYGQRLHGRNADSGPLQLSLVEGAYLSERNVVTADAAAVVDLAREVEGDRFDRRLQAYTALRDAGAVPKSGFKFGADFRVYTDFSTVSDLSHSADLVRVVSPDHTFLPRDLSLDVRLAGGVRKRMVFALTDAKRGIDWLSVARLTP
ncbi:tRNA-intron endonuclease [Halopelagius inordinatus]|uniref:tRNA-splicing endonuclease n=1 Tax=Halopelagius inordinatus TaxID=553467 RepID=A0A1I2WJ49_9EURY|nr:tRNA-intron lyase [Halopelagius inordinatus]SFH01342.1 tRNA-intron endonuclease [Halopelagius inordinatus]